VRAALAALAAVCAAALLAGCGDDPAPPPATPPAAASPEPLRLVEVASGLSQPVQALAVPGRPGALFVVEQTGRVLALEEGRRRTVLDLRERTAPGGERGLLALALHPGFERNGRMFAHYTDLAGDTRLDEYRRAGAGAPAFVRTLLAVDQPYENHNGGGLAFGPDGRLYLGLGDGGDAFDPRRRSQDLDTLLGKLIRFDVDGPEPAPVIVANGLRNPWRFAFDRADGRLYVGDVGQDRSEEVDVVSLPESGLLNFGWDVYEGHERVEGHEPEGGGRLVFPVAVYGHDAGCSITGGVVYRGRALPRMRGRYLYGDFCSGSIWSIRAPAEGRAAPRLEQVRLPGLTSFGEDADGEVLLVSASGGLFRLAGARGRGDGSAP